MVEAVTTAGRSVIIAGCTVVIAVLGLFLTGLPYMYGVAISASLAVLVVMLAAVTLLPALLSYLGPRVDRLRIPLLGRDGRTTSGRRGIARRPLEPRRPAPALDRRDRLRRRSCSALAAPALGMRLGFPDAGNDPPDTMTRQAYDLISRGLRPRHQRPAGDRRRAARPGARQRGRRPRDAASPRARASPSSPPPRINCAGDAAIVTVIPTTSPQDQATEDLVKRLRDDVVPDALGGSGVNAQVGGVDAGARGPERLHHRPHAAVHRRRRRPLLPAAARRLPLAADLAQGGGDEPALGQRRLRRDDAGRARAARSAS